MGQQPDQGGSQPMQQPEMSRRPNAAGVAGSRRKRYEPANVGWLADFIRNYQRDGKTFNSNGTTYTISNPNSVKAYANQPITVGYEMASNNSIRITRSC